MDSGPHTPTRRERHRKAVWLAYGLAAMGHIGLLLGLGHMTIEGEGVSLQTPIEVVLVRPTVSEPPPKPETQPTPKQGGGAPAAASTVRPPVQPPKIPAEIVAPPKPAEEPPLVIGQASQDGPKPGQGQGGSGNGAGGGEGDGYGDGRGSGPRFVRGPTTAELRAAHPREAFRKRQGGRATLSCTVRLDTRLENCRIIDETPPGMGFGNAGLALSSYFRFEPPIRGGQRVSGASVSVGVEWP